MDDALGFLKDKLSQGLSDVEQWGSDAGNDVTHALGQVFGGNSPQTPTQTQQAPQNQQNLNVATSLSKPLTLQTTAPSQQQTPLKTNLFSPSNTQGNNQTLNIPQTLNTKLVNYNAPKLTPAPVLKTTNNGGGYLTPKTLGVGALNIAKSVPEGVINAGKAAYYAPEVIGAELHPNQVPSAAVQSAENKGLTALNQSYLGGALTGPEKLIANNIPTASAAAKQAGFNPNEQIFPTLLKTAAGAASAAYPLYGASKLAYLANPVSDASKLAMIGNATSEVDPDIAAATNAITKAAKTGVAQPESTPPPAEKTPTPASKPEETLGGMNFKDFDTMMKGDNPSQTEMFPQDLTKDSRSIQSLAKGQGIKPEEITQDDKDKASYTSTTPEMVAGKRLASNKLDQIKLRNPDADAAAQDVLTNGGTRDKAIEAYKEKAPGVSDKDAKYRVTQVARESKTALRPNERSINPEEGSHNLPQGKPGDYEQAPINKARVGAVTDDLLGKANKALTSLTQDDRDNFEDYLEGTKSLDDADDADKVQTAIDASKKLTDTGNAFDHSVGGQTPHIDNYFPGYIMRDDPEQIAIDEAQAEQDAEEQAGPEAWEKMTLDERREAAAQLLAEKGGNTNLRDDENFGGYKNQARQFATRAERREANVSDEYDDPRDALTRYANGLKYKIGNDTFAKTAQEADTENLAKNGIGGTVRIGKSKAAKVDLSDQGYKALKSNDINAGKGGVLAKVNRAVKQSLISLGVPHAVIIPQRAAGAWLALHTPALQDLVDGSTDITKVDTDTPIDSNNVEFGNQIDSPLHSNRITAGVSDTSKSGTIRTYNPLTVPKRVVYNWLLPKIHDSLLTAAKQYMDARNIDYDSPQARNIGHQINDVMGYSKSSNSALDQATFAPALIKSTAKMYAKSLTPEGTVARGGVAGQQLFNQAAGFISKAISNQISKSQGKPQNESKDNFWSTVQKEALSPSLYTPFRKGASKGNPGEQVDLGIPGQYQADVLKIGAGLKRGSNGQLQISPNSPLQMASNAAQTVKDVASPVLGAGISAATNQAFNGAQIRNPYAPLHTQIEQTGINTLSNALPINVQGFVNKDISKHLPSSLQSSIDLNQTGPTALNIGGNALGLSPKADTTTGQGPEEQKYYGGITKGQDYIAGKSNNEATQNANMALYNSYFSRTKNNSGQTVELNEGQSTSNWGELANNPTVLQGVQVAQKAQGKGNYDPEWDLNSSQLQTYATYKSLAPGDPEKDVLAQKNPWIDQTVQNSVNWAAKQIFSGTAVAAPGYVPYPTISNATNSAMAQITTLSAIPAAQRTATQISQLDSLENNPGVQSAYNALDTYTNKERASMGLSQINYEPTIPPQVTNFMTAYTAANTADRATMKSANPNMYAAMQQAYENIDLSETEKQGAVAYLGGTPSQDLLSGAYGLGNYDINKGTNANGTSSYSLTNFGGVPLDNSGLAVANSVNGYAPGSSSSSSSSSDPLVAMPKIKHIKQPKMRKPPKLKGFRAPHIKKQGKVKVQSNGALRPTQVLKGASVVKVKAQ